MEKQDYQRLKSAIEELIDFAELMGVDVEDLLNRPLKDFVSV